MVVNMKTSFLEGNNWGNYFCSALKCWKYLMPSPSLAVCPNTQEWGCKKCFLF